MRAVLFDALGTLVRLEPPAPRLRAALRRTAGVDVGEQAAERGFAAEIGFYLENHMRGGDEAGLEALRDDCAAVLHEALGVEGLTPFIRSIGLFNMKAKNVIALSEKLIAEHGGEVPRDRDTLITLPGVGRKTANVVLNCAFGEETFAVDTHVFRVCNRTALAKGKTPEQVEARLEKRVPQPFRLHAHHWLILHGRYVCKARTPECWRCIVADLCAYKPKTPEPARKPAAPGR